MASVVELLRWADDTLRRTKPFWRLSALVLVHLLGKLLRVVFDVAHKLLVQLNDIENALLDAE